MGALFALMLAVSGCESPQISDTASHRIKHIGVVSLLGDTFHAEHIGLTVFNNRSYNAEVPDWQIDGDLTGHVVAMLSSGDHTATALNTDPDRAKDFYQLWSLQQRVRLDSAKFAQLFSRAAAQNYDTLVVIERTLDPNAFLYGFVNDPYGLEERGVLGIENRSVFGLCILKVYDVATRRQLASSIGSGPAATQLDNDIEWKADFASYSAEEKAELKKRVENHLLHRLDTALQQTHLVATPSS